MIETRTGGWLHNREDHASLERRARPLTRSPMERQYLDDQPIEVLPTWIDIMNQGSVGSCAGCARAYIAMAIMQLMYGVKLRFSANHAYRGAQVIDNIRGDRGSTIEGQMRHWSSVGLCLNDTWPYSGRYESRIPAEADAEGANYKLSGYSLSKSPQEDLENIQLGLCADYGMSWSRMIDVQAKQNNGVIEEFNGSGGGGHSVAGVGCVLPSTVQELTGHKPKYDDWYIMILNSWGDDDTGVVSSSNDLILQWGFKGLSFWSLKAIEAVHAHRWTVVALPQGMVVPDETAKKHRDSIVYDI